MKPRLLIVDDETLVCRSLARAFRRSVDVSTAENASQARELLATYAFDVVLSDYNMPGENGLQLLSYVAAQYPLVKRVLMTGDEPAVAKEHLESGLIHASLIKPFDLDHAAQVLGLTSMKLAAIRELSGAVVSSLGDLPVAQAVIGQPPSESDLRALILWQQALLEMPLKHVVLLVVEPSARLGFGKATSLLRYFAPLRGSSPANRLALAVVSHSWLERLAVSVTGAFSPKWPIRTFTPAQLQEAVRWLRSRVPATGAHAASASAL